MLETLKCANNASAPLPERVSNSIMKVDEVFVVDPQQISAVEIQVSFHKHITESLLLGLLLVPSVTDKRGVFRDFPDQKAHLIYKTFTISNCKAKAAHVRWVKH